MSASAHRVNRQRGSRGGGRSVGSGSRGGGRGEGSVSRGGGRGEGSGSRGGGRGEGRVSRGGGRGEGSGSRGGGRGKGRGSRGEGRRSCGGGSASRVGNCEPRDGVSGRGSFRGARGARGGWGANSNKVESFGFRNLQKMAEKDPDELVLDMTSERCLPATEHLVNDFTDMDDGKIVVVLNLFAKACSCKTTRSSLHKLLSKLPKSVYLSLHLSNYINRIANASHLAVEDKHIQLTCMIKIFKELLVMLPSSFADLPIPQLDFATMTLDSKGELFDNEILSEVEGLGALKDEMADKVKQEDEQRSRTHMRRNPRDKAALLDDETPPDDFRDLSIVPTLEDVHATGRSFLRRNKVDGSYNSPEHYLDVQFRLLREDFVGPLRDGINDLLMKMGSAKMGPLQDIRVYHGVRILRPEFTSKGLTHKISFDVSKLRHVRWENSKRLIYGSLLCLSKDQFETIILATVENRDLNEIREGIIEVRFNGTSQMIDIFGKTTYEMVETTAYFEAYRHVLEGLQEIEPDRIPFKRYIVECQPDVQPPAYLRNKSREEVTYDLTPIMKKESVRKMNGKEVRILDINAWPSAEDLQLDESQLKAVQLALTSEFALIQGPPGTGKTYIGLKVVKILLSNKREWMTGIDDDVDDIHRHLLLRMRRARNTSDHPILVVCYTNHALDQFLEGIHEFHPEGIVRVGGRSQSEIMKKCNLGEIKHKMRENKSGPRHIRQAFYEINTLLEDISGRMKVAIEIIQKCMENVVHENEFWKSDHMTKEQFDSLNVNPLTGVRNNTSVMCHWLGLMTHDPFETSVFQQPIAVFPFNSTANEINLVYQDHKAELNNVKPAPGTDGTPGGSTELQGARDSYIRIPNVLNGFRILDTCWSMTILLCVYPMSFEGGPIVCFESERGIIGIQISQDGEVDGKGILTAVFNSRYTHDEDIKPLCKPVLNLNQWNYIAASYDYDTGVYTLWHDGQMVHQHKIVAPGGMEIASQFPVSIGSSHHRYSNSFFKGRICQLHIFPHAIGREQILRIWGIREEDLAEDKVDIDEETEYEENNGDIRYEASAEQDLRILDDDEITHFGDGKKVSLKATILIANPFENENSGVPQGEQYQFKSPKNYKWRIKQTIKKELSYSEMMSSEEAAQVINVWQLSKRDRWRLYRYWVDQLCRDYRQTVERYQHVFEHESERLRELRNLEDQGILKKATVIGMTTTGAARHRKLIQIIKPRITIVEEAAEVLESHIVTSLSPGCQHLILIGDHQQLSPNPTVYDLSKNYQLDISLFERMFKNGLRLERLSAQHRMRPEIAEMMGHIYDDLQNHESVMNYEHVMGVNSDIFFIEHNEHEDFVVEGRSRSNIHEAKYIAALCRYFILQGYERHQITILTMYTGQLIQFKKEMSQDFFRGVRVSAVDNFQGEENDIILLSLVRSNEEGNIGFLRISNRVCVALSRAKKGFYCIGNIDLMCEKERLWKNIIEDMRGKGKVGPHLTLTCQKHPKNIIHASKAEDFLGAPEGGCMERCNARLDCGHVCTMVCHLIDSNHEEYKCRQKCTKMMECGEHMCQKLCWKECGECQVPVSKKRSCGHVHTVECHVDPEKTECREPVSKEIPDCHHQQQVPCYKDPKGFHCKVPCLKMLPCSHPCTKLCSEKCDEKCMVKVDKTWSCGHVHTVECHVDPEKTHCRIIVSKEIPDCHHQQWVSCYKDPKEFHCKAPCLKKLPCSHPCTKLCSECDDKCMVKVPKKWSCGHVYTVECHVDPENTKCTAPCGELMKCKHQCKGNCSDCFQGRLHRQCLDKCNRPLFCGHLCKEGCACNCPPCKNPCENQCVHRKCQNKCGEFCQPCMMKCEWACRHYKCNKLCGQPCDRPRCNAPCRKNLRCGHPCIGMCGEPCPKKCRVCNKVEVTKILFGHEDEPDARFVELQGCGHVFEVQGMDHYMDDVGDDASSFQFKWCPWCKTPIRTTLRYGDITKSKLEESKVKTKCHVPNHTLQLESKRLRQKLIDTKIPNDFWEDKCRILDTLCTMKGLTSDQVNMYENQINFMNFLNKLLQSMKMVSKSVPATTPVVGKEFFTLKERIMQIRSRFSEQEKEEINEELLRVSLLTFHGFLLHQIKKKNIHLVHHDKQRLDNIGDSLKSGKRIGKEDRERYEERIEKISKQYRGLKANDLPAIMKDKDMVVKAMGMSQGHWFKCPNDTEVINEKRKEEHEREEQRKEQKRQEKRRTNREERDKKTEKGVCEKIEGGEHDRKGIRLQKMEAGEEWERDKEGPLRNGREVQENVEHERKKKRRFERERKEREEKERMEQKRKKDRMKKKRQLKKAEIKKEEEREQ